MSLIGKKAPNFTAGAVVDGQKIVESFNLEQFKGKYVVLFFYPLDFTFVCPTELHAFQDKLEAFKALNVEVLACSVDSCQSHLAWLNTPKASGGIQGITYPLISDFNKTISLQYDVLIDVEESVVGASYRGLFLIDKEGIVRHQSINDLPIGRNVNEVLRLVDALQFSEQHGEVCPANWQKGEKAMTADQSGLNAYFGKETISVG